MAWEACMTSSREATSQATARKQTLVPLKCSSKRATSGLDDPLRPNRTMFLAPCSTIQEGILFMQLIGRGEEYWEDFTLKLTPSGRNNYVDTDKLQKAWTVVCDSEPILRTVFTTCRLSKESAFQQVILKMVVPTVSCVSDGTENWGDKEVVEAFRPPIFAASQPQVHLHLVKVSPRLVYATLYMNHALVDGKSLRLISRKLADAYRDPSCISRGPDASKYMAVVYQRMEAAVTTGHHTLLDYGHAFFPPSRYATRTPVRRLILAFPNGIPPTCSRSAASRA